jgi:hypothetical protein
MGLTFYLGFFHFGFPKIHLVFICVDGVSIFLFFHFQISIIFINLSNKPVIINLRSKEINLHNKRCRHNTRSVMTSYL